MPGTVFELSIDDALAIVAAVERDPGLLLWKYSAVEQEALLAEARRVIEQHAHEAAERCFPLLSDQPNLTLVSFHQRVRK
jgi:hypothetical protein